jgi:hypothetical protein
MVQRNQQDYRLAIILVVGVTVVSAVRRFLPALLRADLYVDDLCQHVWWTYQFADPTLFPKDPIAAFMSRPLFAPYGYQAIYRLLVPFVDAQVIAESLPFVLTIPVVILAFLLGQRAAGGALLGGVVGAIYAATGEILRGVDAGLPRSFAFPILMLGVWALLARCQVGLGLALLLGVLFYPPAVVNLGCLATVVLGYRLARERILPQRWLTLIPLGLAAAGVLMLTYAQPLPPDIGPKVTVAEARTMPEFWPGGRSEFFKDDPFAFYFSKRAGIGLKPLQFALWVALVMATTIVFRGAVLFEAWALLGTSLACFALAHLVLFALHLPNRYVSYTLPLFGLLWTAAIVPRAVASSMRWRTVTQLVAFLRRPAVLLALSSLLILGLAGQTLQHVAAKLYKLPPPGQEAAYAFLQTLPKRTLVAAHPFDASHVPLRTRRSVLAAMETSLPYYMGYYRLIAERIFAELTATYALHLAEADTLYTRYGVDVFLVNRQRYTVEGQGYLAPFQDAIRSRLEQGQRQGFALLAPPEDRMLFRQGDYWIVRLGPPREPYHARMSQQIEER